MAINKTDPRQRPATRKVKNKGPQFWKTFEANPTVQRNPQKPKRLVNALPWQSELLVLCVLHADQCNRMHGDHALYCVAGSRAKGREKCGRHPRGSVGTPDPLIKPYAPSHPHCPSTNIRLPIFIGCSIRSHCFLHVPFLFIRVREPLRAFRSMRTICITMMRSVCVLPAQF